MPPSETIQNLNLVSLNMSQSVKEAGIPFKSRIVLIAKKFDPKRFVDKVPSMSLPRSLEDVKSVLRSKEEDEKVLVQKVKFNPLLQVRSDSGTDFEQVISKRLSIASEIMHVKPKAEDVDCKYALESEIFSDNFAKVPPQVPFLVDSCRFVADPPGLLRVLDIGSVGCLRFDDVPYTFVSLDLALNVSISQVLCHIQDGYICAIQGKYIIRGYESSGWSITSYLPEQVTEQLKSCETIICDLDSFENIVSMSVFRMRCPETNRFSGIELCTSTGRTIRFGSDHGRKISIVDTRTDLVLVGFHGTFSSKTDSIHLCSLGCYTGNLSVETLFLRLTLTESYETPVAACRAAQIRAAVNFHLKRPARWIRDEDRDQCSLCHSEFGFLNRKHHCRCCGEIICSACSSHFLVLCPEFPSMLSYIDGDPEAKHRVCQYCAHAVFALENLQKMRTSNA